MRVVSPIGVVSLLSVVVSVDCLVVRSPEAVAPSTLSKQILSLYDKAKAEQARSALEKGAASGTESHPDPFEAVAISFPLKPPLIDHEPSSFANPKKNVVPPMNLNKNGCVVYGAGIADASDFEQQMDKEGCEVHAFDCTIQRSNPAVRHKHFNFHRTCIGTRKGFEHNTYTTAYHKKNWTYEFEPLSGVMAGLGHTNVDVLKFDIEGFEWDLFETEIFNGTARPLQIAFELHTENANPVFVPPAITKGKGYAEVSSLFLNLYDRGYRVISKEINAGDHACAEFVLLNVEKLQADQTA